MKIKDLKVFIVGNPPPGWGGRYFTFVKLTTDNGISGIGECYGATFGAKAMTAMIRMSKICMPWKPPPMNMEASRPPAAMPARGPSQREAPPALAAAPAAPAAARGSPRSAIPSAGRPGASRRTT